MKVPFRLRRVAEPRPVLGLFLPHQDSAALLASCARLGLDPLPRIFALAGGFLLRLRRALHEPAPGMIRLAELSANLLLPADAELIPFLLPDEAAALTGQRGLLFLPQGRVLEFDPENPLSLAAFLNFKEVIRRPWQPLPPGPPLAERITEIALSLPDVAPEEVLDAGGAGIGVEEPGPDDPSLPRKLLGKSTLGLGAGLSWLGKMLHFQAMEKLGRKLMAQGMALIPSLNQEVLGKQEAGLRDLLQKFREGKVEEALRRALPLGGEPPRGASPHEGAQLPYHDARYSLSDLLAGGGEGGAIWVSPNDLYRELQQEYRKQAEEATRRGDYRRAAFIYGKLLGDYRLAAATLAQGGLHRDAAILYLKRLNEPRAAAREFEAAGDVERALELYRLHEDHVRAGDLLRRIGEEEQAVAEYQRAADSLVNKQGYFQAGELMRTKARLPDLARGYYEEGWARRPGGSAVPCALALLDLSADRADLPAILKISRDADDFFTTRGNETLAGNFFNHLARLAERSNLAEGNEDLRDLALLGLARQLRHSPREAAGRLVPYLFGAGTGWETPLVRDAQFATRMKTADPMPFAVKNLMVQGLKPVVTAICQASLTGKLFLGFESGEVARVDLSLGTVDFLDVQPGPVLGLAASPEGTMLVVLAGGEQGEKLSCFLRTHGTYNLVGGHRLDTPSGNLLAPMVSPMRDVTILWDSQLRIFLQMCGPRFLVEKTLPFSGPLHSAILPFSHTSFSILLAFNGQEMASFPLVPDHRAGKDRVSCSFPATGIFESFPSPVSCLGRGARRVELAGIGKGGSLGWLDVDFDIRGKITNVSRASAPGPFRAVACVRAGWLAALTSDAIVWFRVSEAGLREKSSQPLTLHRALACYPLHRNQELAIVDQDGMIRLVKQPP